MVEVVSVGGVGVGEGDEEDEEDEQFAYNSLTG